MSIHLRALLSTLLFTALLATAVTAQITTQNHMIEPPSGVPVPDDNVVERQPATVTDRVYLPTILKFEVSPDELNMKDRASVVAYYNNHYVGSSTTASEANWTGSIGSCTVGETSQPFRDKVLARINYYRAMAGVENDVIFTDALNAKAQAAALMMSTENDLDHFPGASWGCYSATGAEGASKSNLSLGSMGSDAITSYMQDAGSFNGPVGHRRWILFPWINEMGTGDVPSTPGHNRANALDVLSGGNYDATRNARDTFVAWPPPGYVPHQVVFPRWSLSYNGVDFSNATVSMTIDGVPQTLTIETRDDGTGLPFGEHSIVWRISTMSDGAAWPIPTTDSTVHITVANAVVEGTPTTFEYDVIIIQP